MGSAAQGGQEVILPDLATSLPEQWWQLAWQNQKTIYGLVLQHTLPKGFRRARNYGFLHANSKRWLALLQLQLKIIPKLYQPKPRPALSCTCCGGAMVIVQIQFKKIFPYLS